MSSSPTSEKEVFITRHFDASPEAVFAAWSSAEHMTRWSAPEGCSIEYFEFDFRPGGIFRHLLHVPQGKGCRCKGEFREIVPSERLVYTMYFVDEAGESVSARDAGADPDWPDETVVTVTFEREGEGTRMTLRQNVSEALAKRTGAHPSWLQMLDRLASSLA